MFEFTLVTKLLMLWDDAIRAAGPIDYLSDLFAPFPVDTVDYKHFNWTASVLCCNKTMWTWRETSALEEASCFLQMHPALSGPPPAAPAAVPMARPLDSIQAIRWIGWNSNGAANCKQHIFLNEVSTNQWMEQVICQRSHLHNYWH